MYRDCSRSRTRRRLGEIIYDVRISRSCILETRGAARTCDTENCYSSNTRDCDLVGKIRRNIIIVVNTCVWVRVLL